MCCVSVCVCVESVCVCRVCVCVGVLCVGVYVCVWRVWVCHVCVWRVWVCRVCECGCRCGDESMLSLTQPPITLLHTYMHFLPHPPPSHTSHSLPHLTLPHNSPRASSGHAWNQSIVQQLMREGNLRRRLRNASPMGLKARMT